jgi:hypothetical protein
VDVNACVPVCGLQNVVWSFGVNRNVPVLNLSDGYRKVVMYTCAHVGVMYDYENNHQFILQAHVRVCLDVSVLLLLIRVCTGIKSL